MLVVLDDHEGNRSIQAVEPGYGWYPADEWKTSEHVETRFRVPVPEDLRLGTYSLGIVLLDAGTGEVIPALGLDADLPAQRRVPPRKPRTDAGEAQTEVEAPPATILPPASGFAVGEWATGLSITVGSDRDARKQAGLRLAEARVHAADGLCEKAWPAFKDATRHILRDLDWRERKEVLVREELAGCWIARAEGLTDRVDQADALEQARLWDRHHPRLDDAIQPLADELEAEAQGLAAEEQWGAAYLTYARVMRLDPSRSWTRREAERARDHSLGIADTEGEDTADEDDADEESAGEE